MISLRVSVNRDRPHGSVPVRNERRSGDRFGVPLSIQRAVALTGLPCSASCNLVTDAPPSGSVDVLCDVVAADEPAVHDGVRALLEELHHQLVELADEGGVHAEFLNDVVRDVARGYACEVRALPGRGLECLVDPLAVHGRGLLLHQASLPCLLRYALSRYRWLRYPGAASPMKQFLSVFIGYTLLDSRCQRLFNRGVSLPASILSKLNSIAPVIFTRTRASVACTVGFPRDLYPQECVVARAVRIRRRRISERSE
jgi:hypothetical protein